ncbi:MAG: MmcQ/YjbR family DNA-binding protein [Chloroflexota bacterium]|nr:MmcQ/YjbR family DNA-binding protein [Chloroflexota bacterium]
MLACLGAKGWIGVRIDLDAIDWDDITQLVTDSYRLMAPKRLTALTPAFGHPSPTRGEG